MKRCPLSRGKPPIPSSPESPHPRRPIPTPCSSPSIPHPLLSLERCVDSTPYSSPSSRKLVPAKLKPRAKAQLRYQNRYRSIDGLSMGIHNTISYRGTCTERQRSGHRVECSLHGGVFEVGEGSSTEDPKITWGFAHLSS